MLPKHPKQKLLFFVAHYLDEKIRSDVETFALGLASARHWLNGPPHYVNLRDEPQDNSRGDLPIETVGGYLELYSAVAPWDLPREIDLQHLEEVKDLLSSVSSFSRAHDIDFEFELDGIFVGAVADGKMDRSLEQGLLGEWERQLAESG